MRTLLAACLGAALMALVLLAWASPALGEDPAPDPAPELVDGKTAAEWQAEFLRMRKLAYLRRQHLRRYKRVLLHSGRVTEAIQLASTVYGVSHATLLRKALCETGGTLWPGSLNRTPHHGEHASGLFQFLPSTWRSTPFGRYSIWSPWANSLAAGWMHAHGRGGEWACR